MAKTFLPSADSSGSSEDTNVESLPSISGAKNQSGADKPVPLILGKTILSPSYCGSPYRTISGDDGETQTFHALYMLGYRNIEVGDIKLGQIDLSSGTTTEEPRVIDTFGTKQATDINNFYFDTENNIGIEIPAYTSQVTSSFEIKNKLVTQGDYSNGSAQVAKCTFTVDEVEKEEDFEIPVPVTFYIPVSKKKGTIKIKHKGSLESGTCTLKTQKDSVYYTYEGAEGETLTGLGSIKYGVYDIINNSNCSKTSSETDGEYTISTFSFNNTVIKEVSGLYYSFVPFVTEEDIEIESVEFVPTVIEDGELNIDGRWDSTTYNIHLELRNGKNTSREDGEVELYPQKVSQEDLDIELEHIKDESDTTGAGIMLAERVSARNPQKVQIEFNLAGLFKTESGKRKDTTVQICIQYSLDGGKTYYNFGAPRINAEDSTRLWTNKGEHTIKVQNKTITAEVYELTGNKLKELRYIAEREFTYNEAINCKNRYIEFRIFRYNDKGVNTDNDSYTDVIKLSGITTWCYDYTQSKTKGVIVPQAPVIESRRDITTRLGFKINADPIEFKNQIDELNCILESKCRTCEKVETADGYTYQWSNGLSATSNPASVMLMFLQHESRGKYAYTDNQIDLHSLGAFYEECATSRKMYGKTLSKYACNGALTSQAKTNSVISDILSTCRAKLIFHNKKYAVWVDREPQELKMVLNNQNILKNSVNVKKDFAELTDGVKVKFINEEGNYTQDEMTVLYDETKRGTPNLSYKSIEMKYQTLPEQVWQNAMYYLATQKLRNESITLKTSIDGNLIEYGDRIGLQTDTLSVGIGDGAEIQNVNKENGRIVSVDIDGFIDITDYETSEQQFMVAINQTGGKVSCENYFVTPVVDEHNIITKLIFNQPVPIDESYPVEKDILSIGVYDSEAEEQKIYLECIVFGKRDNGDGTFDFTLTPFQKGVYTADSGTIPDFDSKVTKRSQNKLPQTKTATLLDVTQATDNMTDAIAEVTAKVNDIQSTVDNLAENPVVYANISSCGIAVNDNDIVTVEQTFDIKVTVKQGDYELPFYFGEITMPDKFSYTKDKDTLHVTVQEGAIVTTQAFNISVIFISKKYDFEYVSETGFVYVDSNGKHYGEQIDNNYSTTYNLGFTCIGVQGGRYLGGVKNIGTNEAGQNCLILDSDVYKPLTELILGDYFTFTNTEEVESTLVKEDGKFVPSAVYEYIGVRDSESYIFALDTMSEHLTGGTLSDVLNVANDNLEQNNSKAYQFLDHLTANSIFADMIVANNAFINKLGTSKIILQKDSNGKGGIIQSENYNGSVDENGNITEYGTEGWAVDFNGKSDFVNINATGGNFDNINVNNAFLKKSFLQISHDYYISCQTGVTSDFLNKIKELRDTIESDLGYDRLKAKFFCIITGSLGIYNQNNFVWFNANFCELDYEGDNFDLIANGATIRNPNNSTVKNREEVGTFKISINTVSWLVSVQGTYNGINSNLASNMVGEIRIYF